MERTVEKAVVKDLLPSNVGDQRRSSVRTFVIREGLIRGRKEQSVGNVDSTSGDIVHGNVVI